MDRQALSPSTPNSRGMDKYEQLAVVGEGSYGVVLKCRRKDNGKLVAIKKFLETEDDAAVRKMALREIRMLKKLRHDHLVNMIEVFRRKRRFYLVFEYLDRTLLDELEANPGGLSEETSRKHIFQLLRGIEYCHHNSVIHRDVKPENVLISNNGVVKLCDLGFARALAAPGEPYTEYVATRWYRAPELLVAEHRYGPEVDIWAIGCLFSEMLTGNPLFPGDSDIDQLALIVKTVGKLAPRHQQVLAKLSSSGSILSTPCVTRPSLPGSGHAKELLALCLRTEPRARPSATALLRHKYFHADGFAETFMAELRLKIVQDNKPCSPPKDDSATRRDQKQRQWTLSILPETGRPSQEIIPTLPEPLIDCKYTLSSHSTSDSKERKKTHICPNCPNCQFCLTKENKGKELPPARAPRNLGKFVNEAFHTLPVPINNYPRTSYIKKLSNKLVLDEDIVKGRAGTHKKASKKGPADLCLPYIPGTSNSPMKKAKKPSQANKESWEGASGMDSPGSKITTNLPYM